MRTPLPYVLVTLVIFGCILGMFLQQWGQSPAFRETAKPDGFQIAASNRQPITRDGNGDDRRRAVAVEQFKSLVSQISADLPKELKGSNLVSVTFDVRDNSSLVAPLTGTLNVRSRLQVKTSAKDADEIESEMNTTDEWNAQYAYTNDGWECIYVDRTTTDFEVRYSARDENKHAIALSLLRAADSDMRRKLVGQKRVWEHEQLQESDWGVVRVLRDTGR